MALALLYILEHAWVLLVKKTKKAVFNSRSVFAFSLILKLAIIGTIRMQFKRKKNAKSVEFAL